MVFDKKKSPYLFLIPFLVMFCIFWLWPILQSFYWSLLDWDGLREPVFIGFKNYIKLFMEEDYLIALRNTLLAAGVYIIVMVVFALFLGFMLNSKLLLGRTAFRTIIFLPVTVSLPVIALVFFIIYARNNGVLNNIIFSLGFSRAVDWLGDSRINLWSIVALRIWRASGFYAVFVLAGLQAIPEEVIEASYIDGANGRQIIRRIILPLLKPVIIYIVVASSIWAFQLFEEPWILTKGGPINSTATIAMHVYRNGFQFFQLGYASASAYVLALLIILFALLQLFLSRDKKI
jgi:lactose/L-arabinose transport system permease protein